MEFEWFQMEDLKKLSFNKKNWVPLYSCRYTNQNGMHGTVGYQQEYSGIMTIMFPIDKHKKAISLKWDDVANNHTHCPYIDENNIYRNANYFGTFDKDKIIGQYILLIEDFETRNPDIWHLDLNLLLGLNLEKRGDIWVCPKEDDITVVRMFRSKDGNPIHIEIRAEHLRDFLRANNSGLLVARYHKRLKILEPNKTLDKVEEDLSENYEFGKWKRSIRDIHEGNGLPFGASTAVYQFGHKNIDINEDIPVLPHPSEADLSGKSKTFQKKERRLKQILAHYWINDWITPSKFSPRIKRDSVDSTVTFLIDNEGTRVNSDNLKEDGRWLWFDPEIINELLKKPYGYIGWHTRELFDVGRNYSHKVTVGVNNIGLVVVYAKDIAYLPEVDKRIWAAKNVSPEGGINSELHTTQVLGLFVDTQAPECLIKLEVEKLQQTFENIFKYKIFKEHYLAKEFDKRIHRFKATSDEGLYLLCKEITRIIIERIDLSVLIKIRPKVNKEFKSLKRFELLLDEVGEDGRKLMAPLAGIYELRNADSHLPKNEIEEAKKLIGIHNIEKSVMAGTALIWYAAKALNQISNSISKIKT